MKPSSETGKFTITRFIRYSIALLLTIATIATIWYGIASYNRKYPRDGLWITSPLEGPQWYTSIMSGSFYLVRAEPWDQGPLPTWDKKALGFGYKQDAFRETRARGIQAPFWALALVLAFYPFISFLRGPVRRRRRRKQGKCLQCGYALTNLSEERCPECGTNFDPKRLTNRQKETSECESV